jgi:hypothetical protein
MQSAYISHASRDIVDAEPLNGNVWKMLLGAIDKWFDEQTSTPAS